MTYDVQLRAAMHILDQARVHMLNEHTEAKVFDIDAWNIITKAHRDLLKELQDYGRIQ